jgi:hypothetical protein
MGDMRRRARRVFVVIAAGLALPLAACGGGSKTVAPGFPAVDGSGANFELVVDGTNRTDSGGNGAYLVDDAVAANRHFNIAGTDTIVTVPSLTVGTFSIPPPNDNLSVIYNVGTKFYSAATTLNIQIVGNESGYVWGSFDGMFSDAFAPSAGQTEFAITGKFAAHVN